MLSRFVKKKNFLKRLILKCLNVYAFQKENFEIINPNLSNHSKNYYQFNDKNFILSSGYIDITRKINSLDIYYRYSPHVALWNSSGSWKRVIPNIDKETLIKVCFSSLIDAILHFNKETNIDITLHLVADNSNDAFDNELKESLQVNNINHSFVYSAIPGNRGSFLQCCNDAKQAKDLIFFIEDDYLFEKNAIEEMLFSYSRISTLFSQDIFMCPSDFPFYYDKNYSTSVIIGKNHRWRFVPETLCTFMFSKKLYDEFNSEISLMGKTETNPFEAPLTKIYKGTPCFAPIYSLSHHISRSVPAISEDWLSLWKTHLKKTDQCHLPV